MSYGPIPPEGCSCAFFWTLRRQHKAVCPITTNNRKPDAHLIHRTKNLFDGECVHCRKEAGQRQALREKTQ